MKVKNRIKSKYRPFKNSQECWEEMQKHQPFGWIRIKSMQSYCIFSIDECANFDYRFTNYLFADGTPFGINLMKDSTSSNNDDCETESHKCKDDSISSNDNKWDKEYREEA